MGRRSTPISRRASQAWNVAVHNVGHADVCGAFGSLQLRSRVERGVAQAVSFLAEYHLLDRDDASAAIQLANYGLWSCGGKARQEGHRAQVDIRDDGAGADIHRA